MNDEALLDAPVKVRSTISVETEFTKDTTGSGTVLMRAVRERWEAGSVCRAARLPFLALLHVRGGESLLRSRGVVQRLRPGAVVALGGDHDHAFACPKTHLDIVLLNWGGDAQQRAHAELGSDTFGFAPRDPAAVAAAFDAVLDVAVARKPLAAEICAAHLPVLLLTLRANRSDRLDAGGSAQTFAACRTWIDEHHREVTTVAEVAAACHVGHEYLCRLFKRHAGTTPQRYLSQLKLTDEAKQLAAGTTTIKESARRCGFSDAAAFARAFTRTFGVPPGSYRG
jgi:AraC-like DNA-binding protein